MMKTMVWVVAMTLAACATSGDDGGIAEEQSEVKKDCPSGPGVNYISKKQRTCALVRFACEPGFVAFNNQCGCGCEPEPATTTCMVTGCSGQICASEDTITTCEYRDYYACYGTATCEAQADGQCGWTQTAELDACIAANQDDGGSIPL